MRCWHRSLEQGAYDVHVVQLMPLYHVIFYFIKMQNSLPFCCWLGVLSLLASIRLVCLVPFDFLTLLLKDI